MKMRERAMDGDAETTVGPDRLPRSVKFTRSRERNDGYMAAAEIEVIKGLWTSGWTICPVAGSRLEVVPPHHGASVFWGPDRARAYFDDPIVEEAWTRWILWRFRCWWLACERKRRSRMATRGYKAALAVHRTELPCSRCLGPTRRSP